jgi:hypothetical protein
MTGDFRKIGKPNNFKMFGNNKTKRPKQDSNNQTRSPIYEGYKLIHFVICTL